MLWWGALVDTCVWGCLGAGGSGDGVSTDKLRGPQRHSAANGGSGGSNFRRLAGVRDSSERSEDLRQRWRPLFTDVVGSLPPAGKSAFVEAVVGKRLPLSLISIPSSHPKGVRQRFERRRAKNTT